MQKFYSSFESNLLFTIEVNISYTLPGDPASALNLSGAGHVLSSITSTTEGNDDDADDPSTLASDISAAHIRPSATAKVLSALDYHHYMNQLLAIKETTPVSSPGVGSRETSPTIKGSVSQA